MYGKWSWCNVGFVEKLLAWLNRFTRRPRQEPFTEASTAVDHASACTSDTNQFGALAPAQLVVFIEKQAGVCMTPSPS